MLAVAGLSMTQADEQELAHEQLNGPQGQGYRPRGQGSHSMRFTDQEWVRGPQGQMSLGEMLQLAGY
eukprot:8727755-Karenia_brevis.AAC.1